MMGNLIINIILILMVFAFFLKGNIILNLIFLPLLLACISDIVLTIAKIRHKKIDKKLFRKIYFFGFYLFFILLTINFIFLAIKEGKYYAIIIAIPFLLLMIFGINEEVLEKHIIKLEKISFFKSLPLILGIIILYIIILMIAI